MVNIDLPAVKTRLQRPIQTAFQRPLLLLASHFLLHRPYQGFVCHVRQQGSLADQSTQLKIWKLILEIGSNLHQDQTKNKQI